MKFEVEMMAQYTYCYFVYYFKLLSNNLPRNVNKARNDPVRIIYVENLETLY